MKTTLLTRPQRRWDTEFPAKLVFDEKQVKKHSDIFTSFKTERWDAAWGWLLVDDYNSFPVNNWRYRKRIMLLYYRAKRRGSKYMWSKLFDQANNSNNKKHIWKWWTTIVQNRWSGKLNISCGHGPLVHIVHLCSSWLNFLAKVFPSSCYYRLIFNIYLQTIKFFTCKLWRDLSSLQVQEQMQAGALPCGQVRLRFEKRAYTCTALHA